MRILEALAKLPDFWAKRKEVLQRMSERLDQIRNDQELEAHAFHDYCVKHNLVNKLNDEEWAYAFHDFRTEGKVSDYFLERGKR